METCIFDLIIFFFVLPHSFDVEVHKALFKQAMRHWENYTCIQVSSEVKISVSTKTITMIMIIIITMIIIIISTAMCSIPHPSRPSTFSTTMIIMIIILIIIMIIIMISLLREHRTTQTS